MWTGCSSVVPEFRMPGNGQAGSHDRKRGVYWQTSGFHSEDPRPAAVPSPGTVLEMPTTTFLP